MVVSLFNKRVESRAAQNLLHVYVGAVGLYSAGRVCDSSTQKVIFILYK